MINDNPIFDVFVDNIDRVELGSSNWWQPDQASVMRMVLQELNNPNNTLFISYRSGKAITLQVGVVTPSIARLTVNDKVRGSDTLDSYDGLRVRKLSDKQRVVLCDTLSMFAL